MRKDKWYNEIGSWLATGGFIFVAITLGAGICVLIFSKQAILDILIATFCLIVSLFCITCGVLSYRNPKKVKEAKGSK